MEDNKAHLRMEIITNELCFGNFIIKCIDENTIRVSTCDGKCFILPCANNSIEVHNIKNNPS